MTEKLQEDGEHNLRRISPRGSESLRCALVLLLGVLLTAPAFAQKQKPVAVPSTVTVPIRYAPPRIIAPLIRVRINGGKLENFVLDTGAGYPLILTENYVRREKLPLVREKQVVNNAVSVPFAQVTQVAVEARGLQLSLSTLKRALVIDAPVEALAPGENVAGIIGVAFLAQTPAQLDFVKQTLTLYSPTSPIFTPPPILPFPLLPNSGGTYNARIKIAPDVPVNFLVDTGAFASQVEQAVLDKLPKTTTETTLSAQVQGLYLTETAKVRAIRIGRATEKNVAFDGITPEMKQGAQTSLLGMALLQHFRVTFDIPHQQLYLEPNPQPKFRAVAAESGIALSADEAKTTVESVDTDSAAAQAGLHAGDELIAIDGVPVAGEAVYALQRLLDGYVGTEARLEVQRAAKQTLRFARTKAADSDRKSNRIVEGAVGRALTGMPLELFALDPESPLYGAGVRTGEQIVRINGEELAQLTTQQKIPLLRLTQATLVVRNRKGEERTVQITMPAAENQRR